MKALLLAATSSLALTGFAMAQTATDSGTSGAARSRRTVRRLGKVQRMTLNLGACAGRGKGARTARGCMGYV